MANTPSQTATIRIIDEDDGIKVELDFDPPLKTDSDLPPSAGIAVQLMSHLKSLLHVEVDVE